MSMRSARPGLEQSEASWSSSPVWAPAQSFSTREQSRASASLSGGSAPATSHSARQSATQTAADEDRPAPRGRSLAIVRRQPRSSIPSRASSAAAPRTSAAPALGGLSLGAKVEAVGLAEVARVRLDRAARRGLRGHRDAALDGEGEAQPVVVVGVLADHVHAPRGERLDTRALREGRVLDGCSSGAYSRSILGSEGDRRAAIGAGFPRGGRAREGRDRGGGAPVYAHDRPAVGLAPDGAAARDPVGRRAAARGAPARRRGDQPVPHQRAPRQPDRG